MATALVPGTIFRYRYRYRGRNRYQDSVSGRSNMCLATFLLSGCDYDIDCDSDSDTDLKRLSVEDDVVPASMFTIFPHFLHLNYNLKSG